MRKSKERKLRKYLADIKQLKKESSWKQVAKKTEGVYLHV
jgi:hypothetical protein